MIDFFQIVIELVRLDHSVSVRVHLGDDRVQIEGRVVESEMLLGLVGADLAVVVQVHLLEDGSRQMIRFSFPPLSQKCGRAAARPEQKELKNSIMIMPRG
jgi:hypothetical protein